MHSVPFPEGMGLSENSATVRDLRDSKRLLHGVLLTQPGVAELVSWARENKSLLDYVPTHLPSWVRYRKEMVQEILKNKKVFADLFFQPLADDKFIVNFIDGNGVVKMRKLLSLFFFFRIYEEIGPAQKKTYKITFKTFTITERE